MHISDAANRSTCSHTNVPQKQFPTPEFQKPPALGHHALGPRSKSAHISPRNSRLDLSSALPGLGSTASTCAVSGSSAIGSFTDEVRAELARHWPSRYVHFDASAFVLNTIPSSEDRQKKLIRMTIDSAKRFAILTSFNVNPTKDHEPGHVSATTFAMLESLAKKQHDSYFKFVFLYNDNKLQRNALVSAIVGQNVTANMSLKSKSQIPGTITWPAVVESYNRQQCVEELRIGHVKCGIYFVAAKAKGAAGSHHNKFCINDQGVAATMGASIANKTKGGWMDGGCIAISAELASSQRHYFLDELIGGHAVQCAQLQMDGGTPSMAPVQDLTALQALADIEVRSPLDMGVPGAEATLARFQNALNGAGVLLKGGRHKVLWVQNPSDGYKNMFSTGGHIEGKPIGRAIASIFRSAVAGESIDIVGKKIGTEALAMIKEALSKGCHVNVLVDHSSRSWVEYAARHFYAEKTAKSRGSLTVRHYEPSARLAREHHLDTEHEQVLHAKNYVLTRNDGSYVLMTGSYNLDGQSHYRSNENLMVFESTDADLRKSLFDDLYYGSNSTISHYPAQAAHRRSGVRPMAS